MLCMIVDSLVLFWTVGGKIMLKKLKSLEKMVEKLKSLYLDAARFLDELNIDTQEEFGC